MAEEEARSRFMLSLWLLAAAELPRGGFLHIGGTAEDKPGGYESYAEALVALELRSQKGAA